jgi:hypothetical protein
LNLPRLKSQDSNVLTNTKTLLKTTKPMGFLLHQEPHSSMERLTLPPLLDGAEQTVSSILTGTPRRSGGKRKIVKNYTTSEGVRNKRMPSSLIFLAVLISLS